MIRNFKLATLLAVVVASLGTTSAFAQSPAETVYSPNNGVLDTVSGGGPDTPGTAPDSGNAPANTNAGTSPSGTSPSGTSPSGTSPSGSAPASASAPTTETASASTGSLPFTGLEVGFVVLAGCALLAGGFAMRRVTRDEG